MKTSGFQAYPTFLKVLVGEGICDKSFCSPNHCVDGKKRRNHPHGMKMRGKTIKAYQPSTIVIEGILNDLMLEIQML